MYEVINSCDELIEFVINNSKHPEIGFIEYKGTKCSVDGMIPNLGLGTFLTTTSQYPKTIFIVTEECSDVSNRGHFMFCIANPSIEIDQMPVILLPMSARSELIYELSCLNNMYSLI